MARYHPPESRQIAMVAFSRPLSAPLIKELQEGGGRSYRIHIEGREALYGVQGSCAVVTIFGDLREGKTWLLNYMMKQEMLKVSNRATETKGVDVALPRLTGSQFASTWGVIHDANAPGLQSEMVFLDVEGHGERDSSHDYTILAPAALVSDIIIMNVPGYPGRDQVLNKLNLLYQLTRRLQGANESTFRLGHVHLVCRDYTNMQSPAEIHHEIMNMESGHGRDAQKRNNIRTSFEDWFESVTVHLLPMPTHDPQVISGSSSLAFDQVSAPFEAGVRALAQSIVHQLQGKRGGFLGTELAANGPLICEAMHSLLERVHEEGIDVPDLVDEMFQGLCRRAVKEVEAELQREWGRVEEAVTQVESPTASKLVDLSQVLRHEVLAGLEKVFLFRVHGVPDSVRAAHWDGVVKRVAQSFHHLLEGWLADLAREEKDRATEDLKAAAAEMRARAAVLHREVMDANEATAVMERQHQEMLQGWKEEMKRGVVRHEQQMEALRRKLQEAADKESKGFGLGRFISFLVPIATKYFVGV